jgi:hypothetical protein
VNFIYVIILGLIAGIAKAGRDTIAHHWDSSIFNEIRHAGWRKWFMSWYLNKPDHPIWFLWDGWHCFDTLEKACYLSIILLTATKRFETNSLIATNWSLVIVVALGAIVGFNLCYHWIFIHREENS